MKNLKTIIISTILTIIATANLYADFDNTNILVEKAVNDIYQKRYKQAHATLKEAYEKSPRHPGVHFNLGRLFELTGNFQEALKEYRIAASLDQSMVAARRGVARCSVEIKKAGLAESENNIYQQKVSTAPVVTQTTNSKSSSKSKSKTNTVPTSNPVSVPVIISNSKQNNYTLPDNPFPQNTQISQNNRISQNNQSIYSGYESTTIPTSPTTTVHTTTTTIPTPPTTTIHTTTTTIPTPSTYTASSKKKTTSSSSPIIVQNNNSYSLPAVTKNSDYKSNAVLQTSKVYSSTNNLDLPPLPQSVTLRVSKSSGESKARDLLDNGKTDEAIKVLDNILEKNPDSPEAHYLMGKALTAKNNLFAAVKHLEETIKVDEKYYDAYYLLGKNYAKVNLMDDAIKNYLVYYGVKPQASVAVEIAKIYENMGKQSLANDFYRRASAMNPGNSNLQMQVNESSVSLANDLYLRANHSFSIKQYKEAADLFNQAISTNSLPESTKRDAVKKYEIAKFKLNELEQQIAPMKQGFNETRKNFAPTSLKYYQLADINYKNNYTNAIYVEWTGYIARKISRYGREFLLMIKECDRDELESLNKTYNDYKLNKHFNNQPVFLIMTSKGGFPDFIKENVMITFTGKTEWQSYEIVNDMGSTVKLPTFEYVSAYPVRNNRR